MLNRATLIGNVGRDPDIRSTTSGRVANLSLATSESWKDRVSGERREKTEWHRVVVFNDNLIDVIERYVKKGTRLLVEGKIQTRRWQNDGGADVYTTEIVLGTYDARLLMLGTVSRDDPPPADRATTRPSPSPSPSPSNRDLDDDIPF